MSDWISVKDRLPEEDGGYLCCCKNSLGDYWRRIAFFTHNPKQHPDLNHLGYDKPMWFDYDSEYGEYEATNITHWMPLPEPPKKED